MKLLTLLFSLLLLFSKCTLGHDGKVDSGLLIENKTSKNIEIITYQYGYSLNRQYFKTINIAPNDTYNESFSFWISRWDSDMSENALLFATDSIIIVYEKEKFKSFTCINRGVDSTNCDEARNPLRNKTLDFIEYTITEEDYQNAEDCNGQCE